MAELYVELYNIPADGEGEVRTLLRKHGYDVDDTDDLYGDQWQNYEISKYATEPIFKTLTELRCSFRLVYRGEYDGAIEYDPELGRFEEEHGEGGDVVVPGDLICSIYQLDSIEEIRKLIDRKTGKAWSEKFTAYELRRRQG